MRSPDSPVIGVARLGTTASHARLLEHPQIFVPEWKRPEPNFFLKSAEHSKGLEYYAGRCFEGCRIKLVAGEISTSCVYPADSIPLTFPPGLRRISRRSDS